MRRIPLYTLYRMKQIVRRAVTGLVTLAAPSPIARVILNTLGHKIGPGVRIGFSLLLCDYIALGPHAVIGHFNVCRMNRLVLRNGSILGRSNILVGPFDVALRERAAIGNRNRILRGQTGVSFGPARLFLDHDAKITSDHRIDCTQSVHFGAYSHLAGAGSQVWTHAYVHEVTGPGRYRIDGRVIIEANVYVGSACVVSLGVRIGRGVIVGAGSTVSRSILEPGMYVSSPLRVLPRPPAPHSRSELRPANNEGLCESVFVKQRP